MVERQLLERAFVSGRRARRRFPDRLDAELAEQDFLDLLGRIQVERLPRLRVRGGFDFHHLDAELAALRVEQGAVDQHAIALHRLQHRHHGHFDLAIDSGELRIAFDPWVKGAMQLQRDVGIFGGVFGRALDRNLVETDLAHTFAADFHEGNGFHAEMTLGHVIHVMRLVAFDHVRLQQRIVRDARQPDAVIGE